MATPADKKDLVAWVGFPERQARLKRLVVPNGTKGLLLRTATDAAGDAVQEKALAFGFRPLKADRMLQMVFPDGRIPFSPKQLAEALGGTIIPLTRDDLTSGEWTITLSARVPENLPKARRPVAPARDSMVTIGHNMRGEEVIRDATARYVRQVVDGESQFTIEDRTLQASLFLRAPRAEDLPAVAAGLVHMATRGTLHVADYERVLDAAIEEGPAGASAVTREAAEPMLRAELIRQITSIGVEGEAGRDKFQAALKVSENAGFITVRPSDAGGDLSPSLPLLVFLRRSVRGASSVDFRGSEDLALAMPRGRSATAGLQVHDLASAGTGALAYVMNVLGRRDESGRSIFVLPGGAASEDAEMIRNEIGRSYAFDAVAEFAPAVADGLPDAEARTIFFVGQRRPEVLETLPQAAMRTFTVLTAADLLNLEREVQRSRNRIKDFHQGVEEIANEAAEQRAENDRQRPYQSLSRLHQPFTMIPGALEGGTAIALERLRVAMEPRGGVDAVVAASLGFDIETLGRTLNAEQIDAVGLRMLMRDSNRAFLEADATGIGKGRTLSAIGKAHLREPIALPAPGAEVGADADAPARPRRKKLLYITESGTINVPDVCRDLLALDALDPERTALLSAGSQFIWQVADPVSGKMVEHSLASLPARRQREIFESGEWPEDIDVIVTTYSKFNSPENDPRSDWLVSALDEDTLIIMDEAHNALNARSNTGRNLRAARDKVGAGNIVDGTATPARDPKGMNLYTPQLPRVQEDRLRTVLDNIEKGGEVAQEAFATMMAQDGAMIRRDHDLSNIEFKISLPDDETMLRYNQTMDLFSPVVEMMIGVTLDIGEATGRRQAIEFRNAINRGMSEEDARATSNTLNQYSLAVGSPLSALQRLLLCAMKVDQMVDAVLEEIAEGRKPLITFHSTNEALLRELSKGPDGKVSDEAMAAAAGLTLKDQIRRVHNSIYRVKDNDEVTDARTLYPEVGETAARIEQLIDAMPDSLSVSPVDALIERLEANGIAVGEISGRTLCYRDGMIQRRQGRKRRQTIDAFNDGDLDVMLFNQAGATGGSFHASPDFKDQRPRSQLEFETPLDIIKYVQALGRGNRYGQLHKPRVRSVSTGLAPEMRIDQQKNNKLRKLGASVDGNRAHPMLVEEVPDLLNKVGDLAARNTLVSMPTYARRLGFSEYAADTEANAAAGTTAGSEEVDSGSGSVTNGAESLANKVMVRSMSLQAREQNELMQRIVLEFDALIEELDSRNANPLKPKMLDGRVEIVATGIFSGQEADEGDLSRSAFTSPLYISTGIHHFDEEAWNGDKLVEKVDECRRLYGADGFKPFAERLTQNLPNVLRPLLPDGVPLEEAMADPALAGVRFRNKFEKMADLGWVLENMVPGATIGLPMDTDERGQIRRVIVNLIPPANPLHYDLPSAYKIDTIAPGFSKPERMSLTRIMGYRMDALRFGMGISDGASPSFLEEYDRASMVTRRLPVQILHGNILEAISTSATHDLGSVSLYRDSEGRIHRGIVVQKMKINMEHLPVEVHSARFAAELTYRYLEDRMERDLLIDRTTNRKTAFSMWGMMQDKTTPGTMGEADIRVTMGSRFANFDLVPLRKGNRDWFAERPGLYEALYEGVLPEKKDIRTRGLRGDNNKHAGFVRIDLSTPEGRERVVHIVSLMEDAGLMVAGRLRAAVNEVTNDMERMMNAPVRTYTGVEEAVVLEETPAPAADATPAAPALPAPAPAARRAAPTQAEAQQADAEGVDVAAAALAAAGIDQPGRRTVEEILAREEEQPEQVDDGLDLNDVQW